MFIWALSLRIHQGAFTAEKVTLAVAAEGLVTLCLPTVMESNRAGTWRQYLTQKPWRGAALLVCSSWLAQYAFLQKAHKKLPPPRNHVTN